MLSLDQNKLASKLDATQGFISQCFNGHVAISTSMLINFAGVLRFDPSDIRPGIFRGLNIAHKRKTLVTHTTDGSAVTTPEITVHTSIDDINDYFGVEVNGDLFHPRVMQGEFIVCSARNPVEGDDILVRLHDGTMTMGKLIKRLASSIRVHDLFTNDNIKMLLSTVDFASPIHAIQKK